MKIHPVFTNFLAVDTLNVDNVSLAKKCLFSKENHVGRKISNQGGWQSNNIDLSIFDQDLHREIKERLNHLQFYFELNDGLNISVTDAWININNKNNYNTPHDHGGGLFSGVYYIKAEGDSGDIEFMTPIGAHTFSVNGDWVKTQNPFNSNIQKVKPTTGMLVLFPSWLVHYTRPNKTEHERISIAFNSFVI